MQGVDATGAGRRNGRACSSLSHMREVKFNIGILQLPPALLKHATSAMAFLTRCTGGPKDQIA
jgi:hypothetical protein